MSSTSSSESFSTLAPTFPLRVFREPNHGVLAAAPPECGPLSPPADQLAQVWCVSPGWVGRGWILGCPAKRKGGKNEAQTSQWLLHSGAQGASLPPETKDPDDTCCGHLPSALSLCLAKEPAGHPEGWPTGVGGEFVPATVSSPS